METRDFTNKFELLPDEMIYSIYEYLPPEDILFIIPKISHAFRKKGEKSREELFQKYVSNFLKQEVELYRYDQQELKIITDIIRNNNFVYMFTDNSFKMQRVTFRNHYAKIFIQKSSLKMIAKRGFYFEYYLNSKTLSLCWDPLNYQNLFIGEGTCGNFRSGFVIQICIKKLGIEKDNLFNIFKLNCFCRDLAEEKGVFFWNERKIGAVKPIKMESFIMNAIKAQLKMHEVYFTYLNRESLKNVTFKDSNELAFPCNINGRIVSQKDEYSTILFIKKVKIDNFLTLIWESTDYEKMKEDNFKTQDFLRNAVFSSTVIEFAKILKIPLATTIFSKI